MHHPRRTTSPLLTTLLATSLTFAIAGCTNEPAPEHDPTTPQPAETDATPTPDQSPTTATDPKQAAIDQRTTEAISRYEEYTKISNTSLQQGKSPYPELGPAGFLASNTSRSAIKDFGAELEDRNYKQTGSIVIDNMEFVEYDGDPLDEDFTGHEIHFTSCSDLANVDYVDADGASVVNEQRDRVLMEVTMRGVEVTVNGEPKTVWGVSQNERTEEAC